MTFTTFAASAACEQYDKDASSVTLDGYGAETSVLKEVNSACASVVNELPFSGADAWLLLVIGLVALAIGVAGWRATGQQG